MQVKISTTLSCPPERAWQEIQQVKLLLHIARPLVVFEPIQPNTFPATWGNEKYLVRMRLFGFLPLGKQWIVITLDDVKCELLDDGQSELIEQWRHRITVEPTPEGCTRYTDTVDIEAGLLTFGVWLFANVFFRHRQNRWRKLVNRNFIYM